MLWGQLGITLILRYNVALAPLLRTLGRVIAPRTNLLPLSQRRHCPYLYLLSWLALLILHPVKIGLELLRVSL